MAVLLLRRRFGAAMAAEKVRATVEASRPVVGEQPLLVTVSVGWATSRPPCGSFDTAIRAADEAMYRAKRGGRNRVEPAEAGCRWRTPPS